MVAAMVFLGSSGEERRRREPGRLVLECPRGERGTELLEEGSRQRFVHGSRGGKEGRAGGKAAL